MNRSLPGKTAQIPPRPSILDWEDTLQHSDDEGSSPEPTPAYLEPTQSPVPPSPNHDPSIPPSPNRPSSTSTGMTSPTGTLHLSKNQQRLQSQPLDPGILRVLRPTPSTGTNAARYRFDPLVPRPPHARDPTFGHLPGLAIGKRWQSRIGAAWDGTHLNIVAGISGKEGLGVWSIVVSGGYEDDFDEGYRFIYTGSGGRNWKVSITAPNCLESHFTLLFCCLHDLRVAIDGIGDAIDGRNMAM